jgi:hypothetical protein
MKNKILKLYNVLIFGDLTARYHPSRKPRLDLFSIVCFCSKLVYFLINTQVEQIEYSSFSNHESNRFGYIILV